MNKCKEKQLIELAPNFKIYWKRGGNANKYAMSVLQDTPLLSLDTWLPNKKLKPFYKALRVLVAPYWGQELYVVQKKGLGAFQ